MDGYITTDVPLSIAMESYTMDTLKVGDIMMGRAKVLRMQMMALDWNVSTTKVSLKTQQYQL